MIAEKVKSKLGSGEEVLYSGGDVFEFPNKSVVGSKNFYITSRGRVFAHDTGGIFGEERVLEYSDCPVKAEIQNQGVKLTNEPNRSFSFEVVLSYSEFYVIYKRLEKNKISFENEGSYPNVLISAEHSNEDPAVFQQLRIRDNGLTLTDHKLKDIPFYRIKDYAVKNNILSINGIFSTEQETISKIDVFIPYEKEIEKIIEKIESSSSIFKLIGKTQHIYPAKARGYVQQFENNKEITLAYYQDKLFLVDEDKPAILKEIEISSHQFFYNEFENQLLIKPFSERKKALLLTIPHSEAAPFIKKLFGKKNNSLVPGTGTINGTMFDQTYSNQKILLATDINSMYVFLEKDLTFSQPIPLKQSKLLFDEKNVFLMFENEIVLLKQFVKSQLQTFIPNASIASRMEYPIGFTEKSEPFFLIQTPQKLVFKQSPKKVAFSIENSTIIDISIAKYGTEESAFSEVEIKLKDQKTFNVNVENEFIKDLIYHTYRFSKESLLPQMSSEQLFLSYSRQVNDYILYHYFGRLLAVYEGLKDINQTETDKDLKNFKVVNYLYREIQSQKKQLDNISIYLPAMLGKEENRIVHGLGQPSAEQPYKSLQRNLLNVTGQINRSLNEIENAISAVSFVLIPRVEYEDLTKKKAKRGFWAAGGMTAVGGVLAAATGGAVFVPLLAGAALTGLNAHFTKQDAEEQKKIREQNENYRLDFYVEKIMDSFNHFIETLLPYYISEVNAATFHTYKQVHSQFQPVLDSSEARKYLFEQITQLYTYKQLPIDDSVTMSKKELVELTNDSLNLANERLNHFKLEVESVVPKSIEAPRI